MQIQTTVAHLSSFNSAKVFQCISQFKSKQISYSYRFTLTWWRAITWGEKKNNSCNVFCCRVLEVPERKVSAVCLKSVRRTSCHLHVNMERMCIERRAHCLLLFDALLFIVNVVISFVTHILSSFANICRILNICSVSLVFASIFVFTVNDYFIVLMLQCCIQTAADYLFRVYVHQQRCFAVFFFVRIMNISKRFVLPVNNIEARLTAHIFQKFMSLYNSFSIRKCSPNKTMP